MARRFVASIIVLLFFLGNANSQSSEKMHAQLKATLEHLQKVGPHGDRACIDSIYHQIFRLSKTVADFKQLANSYGEYGLRYIGIIQNLDSAVHYLNLAEELAAAKSLYGPLAKSQYLKAFYFAINSEPDLAFSYLKQAETSLQNVEDPERKDYLTYRYLFKKADVYESFNMYDSALNAYQNIKDISEKKKDWRNLLRVYLMSGLLAEQYDQDAIAEKEFKTILYFADSLDFPKYLAPVYNNLGIISEKRKHLDSAKYYYELSYAMRQKHGGDKVIVLSSLVNTYSKLGEISQANYYLQKIDTLEKTINHKLNALTAYINYYMLIGNKQLGVAASDRQVALAKKRGSAFWIGDAFALRVELFEKFEEYDRAFISLKALNALEDSLLSIDKQKSIQVLQTQFETTKKEQAIRALSQENEIANLRLSQERIQLLAIIILLLLVGVIGFLYNRHLRTKQSQYRIELEQTLLRTQMNPHFIFNSLSSIQNFVLNKDTEKANEYLTKFGELTRSILEASKEPFIAIEKELETLKNYVALESLRFSKQINLAVKLDQEIDGSFDQIPPLFIQPLLENAIKHGFKNKDSGTITLTLEKEKSQVHLSVEDDGEGITDEITNHKSYALDIIRERLKATAKKFKFSTDLKIESKAGEKGFRVKLTLPLVS